MTLEQLNLVGHQLPDNNVLLYHQTESFPPGSGTEKMAAIVGSKIRRMPVGVDISTQKQLRIFELGMGAGALYGALFPLIHKRRVLLRGIDKDIVDLSLARFNLERLKEKYKAEQTLFDFQVADWTNWETLHELGRNSNNVVAFNPPFFSESHELPAKLSHTRRETIFTPNSNELYHYETVFPQIHSILSTEKGSFFIARLPSVSIRNHSKLKDLIKRTVKSFNVPIKTQNIYQVRRHHINKFLILEVN